MALGFVFLWAFLDKAFGLGFSTPSERAWINGGKPTQGYLKGDGVTGPFKDFFQSIASPASDGLFMAAMLGVGLAVILGIGLRVAAVSGSLVMLSLYLMQWPFSSAAGSTNPVVDSHLIYTLGLVVIAAFAAGDTWGLGRRWSALPLVRKQPWLR